MRLTYSKNGSLFLLEQKDMNLFKAVSTDIKSSTLHLEFHSEAYLESLNTIEENSAIEGEELEPQEASLTEKPLAETTLEVSETTDAVENSTQEESDTAEVLNFSINDSDANLEVASENDEEDDSESSEAEAHSLEIPTLETSSDNESQVLLPIEIESLLKVELEEELIEDDNELFQFDVKKYLTTINLNAIERNFDIAKNLAENFHQDRVLFVQNLWENIDHQISGKDLKIIFTDILEKKVKDEVKSIVQTKSCFGTSKEDVKAATELEANIFSAYNIKNPTFSILGIKPETKEYFACFQLESVNFIVQFQELNEFNKLQKNILKALADLINHFALDKRVKVKKKKQKTEIPQMSATPPSTTIQ